MKASIMVMTIKVASGLQLRITKGMDLAAVSNGGSDYLKTDIWFMD